MGADRVLLAGGVQADGAGRRALQGAAETRNASYLAAGHGTRQFHPVHSDKQLGEAIVDRAARGVAARFGGAIVDISVAK